MKKIDILREIVPELSRFNKKIALALKELEDDPEERLSQHHAYSAAKRSALDLKRELAKLTQDSKYRWGKS